MRSTRPVRRSHSAAPRICLAVLVLVSAACTPPEGADLTPSVPEDQLARAELIPTSDFDGIIAQAQPDSDRLAEETAALSARAAALKARAAALDAPDMDAETRARLLDHLTPAE